MNTRDGNTPVNILGIGLSVFFLFLITAFTGLNPGTSAPAIGPHILLYLGLFTEAVIFLFALYRAATGSNTQPLLKIAGGIFALSIVLSIILELVLPV